MLVIAMEVINGTGGSFCFTFEDMMQVLRTVLWLEWSYLISHCQLKLAWSDTSQLLISQSRLLVLVLHEEACLSTRPNVWTNVSWCLLRFVMEKLVMVVHLRVLKGMAMELQNMHARL
eukprot:XP_024458267.1 uncharacterized protein LOC112327817 isoform X1 [Populus trichocarpa]